MPSSEELSERNPRNIWSQKERKPCPSDGTRGKAALTEGVRPRWWWGGRTATWKGLILVKRKIFALPLKWKEGWIHSGSMMYFGRGFLTSSQWNHFLLSKLLNIIFHNFRLGGIISYCNYCLQELHQSEMQAQGWLALGCVPKCCCHVILQQFQNLQLYNSAKLSAYASLPVSPSGKTWQQKWLQSS